MIVLTNKKPVEIKRTLDSVSFADEVILIPDRKVPLTDFSAARNSGLSKAKNDWVLFVDDDEVVSQELATEIKAAITPPSLFSGFYIRRLDKYHGQVLHHGETGNTKIIRLGKKSAGRFFRPVHEVWKINGLVGALKNALIHERGELVAPFMDRMIRYSPLDAGQLTRENKPFTYWRLILNPKAKFILNYFLKFGFLDGYLGLFQVYLMSVQSLTVRVFQWQKS
ncbi:MAG: Glycosyl transferase family 2 [Microgenomates group bacterium GW2011_GWC2_45_8]|nr:MAG: Glycosyl transferase family 2 [Microgenomates group bacterium GW2011_GWC2_45_8]